MIVSLAWVAAALLLVFHSLTYTLYLYEKRVHAPPPREPRPFRQAAVCWLAELGALGWMLMTWPLGLLPARARLGNAGGATVVLVHGWAMTPASMAVLAARLRRSGRTVRSIGYRSLGPDMKGKAAVIEARMRDIARESPTGRIDVVAHSLGGLLVRAAVRYFAAGDYVERLVTLGTPHQGTALAAFVSRPNVQPMRPGSLFLRRLAEDDPVPSAVSCTAIFSTFDALVFPAALAEYPGAMNIEIDDVGHLGLLLSARVYMLVEENLSQPRHGV